MDTQRGYEIVRVKNDEGSGSEVYKYLLGDVENADRASIRCASTDAALYLAPEAE